MGAIPDWYPLLVAARWAGVAPWELAEQPLVWQEWILAAMNSENKAERERMKHKR